ncbi:DNA adenine methylase [Allofranklinella schreckenbergeri]|uniref:site-specific DNA-methyltransferase (adenine-specific) n=1 Tax=Allofranklinella schreckenbergeri TaxID=1076744 RepID=A0A3M6Q648_9BURK|nr:DNA adenine methylase [Allofranklinella schreckenbergeri]
MYSNKLYSPLRYPGGKGPFATFIADVMRKNGLLGGHYLEPYAGGAGVALELLLHGHASHIHINDADPAVYAFWISVTKHSRELLRLLDSTPITIEEWFRWRSVLRGEAKASMVEKGFATLFMNRTNRSGILKAGVIGGQKQNGDYKLDARFKKDVVAARIQAIANYSSSISVYCEDSLNLLNRCSDFLPKKSLIYLDPPYYVKGKGLYRNYYEHDDHAAIAKKLQQKSFKWPWVVSYDNTGEICAMYQMSQSLSYGLNYTAQKRYVGNEVMFFSQNIEIPEEGIPQAKAVS